MEFTKILAYVDERPESEYTLAYAGFLSKATGAEVLLCDVLEAVSEVSHLPHADELDALRTTLIEARTEGLRLQAKKHGLNNVAVSVDFGKTSLEIVRKVLMNRYDLVIKTGRGRTDGRRVVFGSTAMHLVRKCPCPVLLVGPGIKPPPRRVLALVNPVGDHRLPLARKVVTHAGHLARRFDAELRVAHVWHAQTEAMERSNVSTEVVARHRSATHDNAIQALSELSGEFGLSMAPPETNLLEGNAVDRIEDLVREQSIDLIVMGSVGQAHRAGQLVGNVTEEVLTRVDCGVLCIKPDDFVCPIRVE